MTETVSRTEVLSPVPAEALAHLLDQDAPSTELPLLWHTVYLLDRPRQSDLGPDGHPYHALPPSPGPTARRMFAGGRIRTHRLLRIGEAATRHSAIVSTTEKQGRSGPLTFVVVQHRIEQGGEVAVEVQDEIVYRPADAEAVGASPSRPAAPPTPLDTPPDWVLDVDAALLFRFSALTYNAHRIHYDRSWCEREGYAGLVIHGPLQALLAAEALRRAGRSAVGADFSYRLMRPLVGEQRVGVQITGDEITVHGEDHRVTAVARLTPID